MPRREDAEARAYRNHLAGSLLREIRLFYGPPQQPQDIQVARVVSLIDRRLHDADLRLVDLVAAVDCGRPRLVVRFSAAMGCAPMQYLEQRRLEIAASRLRSAAGTIAAIARSCGFADPGYFGYFGKRFRWRYGCSPGRYAQKHRGQT